MDGNERHDYNKDGEVMTNQLFSSFQDAEKFLQDEFGGGESFDVCIKRIYIKNMDALTVYISGLVNGESLAEVLANTQFEEEEEIEDDKAYFHAHFNYHGVDEAKSRI